MLSSINFCFRLFHRFLARAGIAAFLVAVAFPAASAAPTTILVMGDSLSAGYGIDPADGWVALLEKKLVEERIDALVVNASISGETTSGGLARLPGLLERNQVDVVILELGGNDGLRGYPPAVIKENLRQMIRMTRAANASVVLVGLQILPNYGPRYTEQFAAIYPQLARQEDVPLLPFFLEGVATVPGKMQNDGLHPTAVAQPDLLNNLWPWLQPLLQR